MRCRECNGYGRVGFMGVASTTCPRCDGSGVDPIPGAQAEAEGAFWPKDYTAASPPTGGIGMSAAPDGRRAANEDMFPGGRLTSEAHRKLARLAKAERPCTCDHPRPASRWGHLSPCPRVNAPTQPDSNQGRGRG